MTPYISDIWHVGIVARMDQLNMQMRIKDARSNRSPSNHPCFKYKSSKQRGFVVVPIHKF